MAVVDGGRCHRIDRGEEVSGRLREPFAHRGRDEQHDGSEKHERADPARSAPKTGDSGED
ncbi:hypothetical protein Ae406Ps2_6360 [Pseudonocardia sp. Ae406_Ps2]|nr:hypothetical protein Ae331Ps2_6283 [Pseudonocardia sp. Ae331_Ps2]OLL89920.1 hypothetical protein Ae406Ps2_6360 [Pseudonocardia sp. Ae406_Ps2]OLM08397.1 hypothetical protein Ae505Ps2_6103 [Pseudonocardia sp. Ae505_Ps2]OLM08874.1 hypothetical protein Ae706Ps2_6574c [Pseudonocardia sp. Ae706_Ps2]